MPYGFNEIQHTADWALEVRTPDIAGLFQQAALGMNWLMGLTLEPDLRIEHRITASAADYESLLVAFLNEILFEMEVNSTGFDIFDVQLDGFNLVANLEGAPLKTIKKTIKAVTYHNLKIHQTRDGFETTIVFDV